MSYSLQTELANLERNIQRTGERMSVLNDEFWKNGGTCCPNCGCPEYRQLGEQQDRRYARRDILRKKLGLDAPMGSIVPGTPALREHELQPFKVRYRRAWDLHRDAGDNDELKQILEREMDECQNQFTRDQFFMFRKTLPGFAEAWDQMHAGMLGKVSGFLRNLLPNK